MSICKIKSYLLTELYKSNNKKRKDLPPVPDLNQFSAVVFPHDFSGLLREYLSPKSKYKRL